MKTATLAIEALREQLEASLADVRLSDDEKRALTDTLRAARLPEEGLRQLRNQAFELVRQHLQEADPSDPQALVRWLEGVVRALDVSRGAGGAYRAQAWFSPGDDCRHAIIGQLRACRTRADRLGSPVNRHTHDPKVDICRRNLIHEHQKPRPGIGHRQDGHRPALMTIRNDEPIVKADHIFVFRCRVLYRFLRHGRTYQPSHHPRRAPPHVNDPFGPLQKQWSLCAIDAHTLTGPAPRGTYGQHIKRCCP